jgi:hypothetical protein
LTGFFYAKKNKEMKTKDQDWYQEKIQDIKKRKRKLRHVQDSKIVKKMKKDLKVEQRSYKRAEKQHLQNYINEKINEENFN